MAKRIRMRTKVGINYNDFHDLHDNMHKKMLRVYVHSDILCLLRKCREYFQSGKGCNRNILRRLL